MQAYLAVFRSRAQALDCAARLRQGGIRAAAVSTPQETGAGCGLSVRIGAYDFAQARRVISCCGYGALFGYFRVERQCGRTFLTRVG